MRIQNFPELPLVQILKVQMEGIVVRRVIPSDDSCLFNAVRTWTRVNVYSYLVWNFVQLCHGSRQKQGEHLPGNSDIIHNVVAATVLSDPETYSEAFLGKANEEYCAWILNPQNWGGAIELSILAEFYGREIAAYDIQTTRCDLYGQDKNFEERVMLIYDGFHYDALAMSPFEGAPEEFDQTIFDVQNDRTVGLVERLALNLVKEQQRKLWSMQHYNNSLYYNLNFSWPCLATPFCCKTEI
ncbi:hypothetical protein ACJIZ3_020655 [Penstemon smallii]|uniref:Ubiquitin thioesterase OTU n=1 Tax=Penstemon smallii TaxID=265156 RepID=A0ABD3SJR0_9LAMI